MIVLVTTFYELEARFSSHDKGFIENRQISADREEENSRQQQREIEDAGLDQHHRSSSFHVADFKMYLRLAFFRSVPSGTGTPWIHGSPFLWMKTGMP